ncbi:MAG: polysaccharide ABC transporter [Ruminococcaceae bacterium]|nr:polysaccharide ABC transporter [Oscillospiraceae bacterium]
MYLKRFFKDLTKYKKYLVCATKATLKSEVTGSYLAWLWWIIEPFCFMLIYTFISEVVFKRSTSYASIFVFLGLTVWDFFNKNISASAGLLKSNKGIVTKIYLPKYLMLLKLMMVNGFKMLISLGISFLLIFFYRVPLSWHIIEAVPCLAMLLIITFGVGCVFMHFGVYIEDLSKIIRIALRLVFYLTGVFYDITDSIKGAYGELLLKINPVAVAMDGCRKALIYSTSPNWLMIGIWSAVGILLSIWGIVIVYKNENNYGKIL